MSFAKRFGQLEPVHPFFPHLEEQEQVVVIEASPGSPQAKVLAYRSDLQLIPCRCSILHAQCPEQVVIPFGHQWKQYG